MIIRIRTNYGIWKVDLDETSSSGNALTINDLLTYLSDRYKLNTNGIILVKDIMDPNDPMATVGFERDKTLASYQIRHGDMIKVLNKLKKIEVEKSYIEDGHLIPAGISYCVDEDDLSTAPPSDATAAATAPGATLPQQSNTGRNLTNGAKEEIAEKKMAMQIPETKPSSKQEREEDPYAAQVKEIPSNISPSTNPIDLTSSMPDYDFSEDFPQSPEVRPPDQSKRMCLYDNDDDDDHDDSLHFADLAQHPFLRSSLPNYGEHFHRPYRQPLPRDPPAPVSTVDPEVIEEMRKAGVPENQIQQLIDFHLAESLDREISNHHHDEGDRYPIGYRNIDDHLARVSHSIADLENRLKQGGRRGVPPYGVGIGTSTRTRIGLRDWNEGTDLPDLIPAAAGIESDSSASHLSSSSPLLSSQRHEEDHLPHSLLKRLMEEDRLAEIEEKELMDAIRESEELAKKAAMATEAPAAAEASQSSAEEGSDDEQVNKNSFGLLQAEAAESSSSSENEEYDPLLEMALKASLEEQKKIQDAKESTSASSSNRTTMAPTNRSSTSRVSAGEASTAMRAGRTDSSTSSSSSSSSSSKKPKTQPIPYLEFSQERKSSSSRTPSSSSVNEKTEADRRISQPHVERISPLSRGPREGTVAGRSPRPIPMRQAPPVPTRSSSSPRSTHSSPREKESPRTSARGWNGSTKPAPRGTLGTSPRSTGVPSRTSLDRKGTHQRPSAAAAPPLATSTTTSRRPSASSLMSAYEKEMLDHAMALSLAESIEKETPAPRPRASSGYRGGARDRERDLGWDREAIVGRRFGTPLDSHGASSSGGSRRPAPQEEYLDDEEALAQAIAESKRYT